VRFGRFVEYMGCWFRRDVKFYVSTEWLGINPTNLTHDIPKSIAQSTRFSVI